MPLSVSYAGRGTRTRSNAAGLVFGHFGDRIGRKQMLLLTLLIMGLGTALMGPPMAARAQAAAAHGGVP
jgi:MFS family permease